ncbi:uncharacterized protein EDB91DRAFT_1241457 [Suillus paluster]|uniref:uncharacterized protein n=1 Tax=Suillus paluster TaxID=48578 RepID=UPI001B86D32B|nr:uncharacterized protein EDB91DRAFT_1241457 [Suillus paluster]KAG1756384.1 hypothetical protein EDB91DRAFT_1241457 [Suillus paluster]
MRVWSSENSPNEDADINQSGLDLEEAINEVNAELDRENSISDVEKLTELDAEQTKVLNDAINHQCKKLWEWFRNNTKGKTTPGGTSTSKMLSALLGQLYLQLHYESKVKPLVSYDIKENKLVLPDQKLRAVQQHTSECFAKESEDVKDDVCDETVHINAARKLGSVAVGQDRTKEEIYHAIQELPIVLGQIFEELSTLMGGWHYSLVMGGPNPLCEGDIMTLSYHHGKTLEGLSFKVSMPNFHKQFLTPFERHLGRIYSSSAKGTSVPTSTSGSPPPSTTDLASPSAPSSPPLLTMDLIPTSTLTSSLPPLTTDLASPSAPSLPPLPPQLAMDLISTSIPTSSPPSTMDLISLDELPDQSSVPLLPRQEFNTPLMDLDSPITSWRRDYVDDGNTTLSVAFPSATVTQPQVCSPSLTLLPLESTLLPQPLLPDSPVLSSINIDVLPVREATLVHSSEPLISSELTVTTQARRSGCPGRPST